MNRVYLCTTGYSAAIEHANRMARQGIRQSWCTGCSLWRWPDEPCCNAERLTAKGFAAMVKAAEKRYPADAGEQRYRAEWRKHQAQQQPR